MSKPISYIGITGFMSHKEARDVLEIMPMPSPRVLMVGVLASQKTAIFGLTNKRPGRYPKAQDIAEIFPCNPLALNFIHYATDEVDTLGDQLDKMVEIGGPYLDGFQLNISWPDPKILEKFRKRHNDMFIVLQIGRKALDAVEHNPAMLATKIKREYFGLIDYVLLDPSGGLGRPLVTAVAHAFLTAMREEWLERFIRFGVAGGLSPTTLDLVQPLIKDFRGLCTDAEGRLRDENDSLIVELAKQFVAQQLKMMPES